MKRIGLWVGLSLSILAVVSLYAWSKYPEMSARIPVHYGFDGKPDRWSDKSIWNAVLMLPLIGLFFSMLMHAIGAWLPAFTQRHMAWVNIPRKAEVEKLPADKQRVIFTITGQMMHWLGVEMALIFAGFQWMQVQLSLGLWKTLPVWLAMIPLGIILGTLVIYTLYLMRTIDHMVRHSRR